MGNSKCTSNIKTISEFLNTTKANWRSSIYIECSVCKYEKDMLCEDYLFAPNTDGTPLIIPVTDMNIIGNMITDKSECLAIMSNVRFIDLYSMWFANLKCPENTCLLKHAVNELYKPENW